VAHRTPSSNLLKEVASIESSKQAARNIILWSAIYVNRAAKFQLWRRKKNQKNLQLHPEWEEQTDTRVMAKSRSK
jgi:hypothetical protein